MSDSVCDICGSPMRAGGSGGGGGDVAAILAAHLADFGDPHRTLPQAPKSYYGLADPVVDSSAYRPGDFYFDLSSGRGYSFRMTAAADGDDPAVYEWARIITPYTGTIDLSAYLLSSVASSTYVTKEYAAAHYLTSASLDGYVTSGSLSSTLANYVTLTALTAALSSSGYITQAFADSRYQRVASAGDVFVSQSDLETALADYTPTADLATALSLANYLTITAADSNAGFIRKSAISTYLSGYVTSAALAAALAGYVTPGYLSANGYLTQALGDARYVQLPNSSEYALKSYIDSKLAEYKKTSELATYLGLANYLTKAEAAGDSGYIPKSSAGSLDYATQAWVTGQLANYVMTSGLSAVQAAIQTAVVNYAATQFVTRSDFEDAIGNIATSSGAYGLASFRFNGTDPVEVRDRHNNFVVMTGSGHALPILLPVKVFGVSRDFLVVVKPETGAGMWGGGALSVTMAARVGELPVPVYVSADGSAPEIDATGHSDLGALRLLFAFTEVAEGEFMVSTRTLMVAGIGEEEEN